MSIEIHGTSEYTVSSQPKIDQRRQSKKPKRIEYQVRKGMLELHFPFGFVNISSCHSIHERIRYA